MSVAGGSVIVRSPNLPFALAQARAVALAGRQAWLRDEAGHCVEIAAVEGGLSLTCSSPLDPPWLDSCRALLADHG